MLSASQFIENLRRVFGHVEMAEAFPYVYMEVPAISGKSFLPEERSEDYVARHLEMEVREVCDLLTRSLLRLSVRVDGAPSELPTNQPSSIHGRVVTSREEWKDKGGKFYHHFNDHLLMFARPQEDSLNVILRPDGACCVPLGSSLVGLNAGLTIQPHVRRRDTCPIISLAPCYCCAEHMIESQALWLSYSLYPPTQFDHIEKLQPLFAQYERVQIFHAHSHAPTVEPWTQALKL
jgi:hypothetical protein